VSPDGNTVTLKATSDPPDSGQLVTVEVSYTRVGKAPAGAHGASGSWRLAKVKQSENGLMTTYKSGSGGELSMSQPTGECYTANLDGRDYPAKGSYTHNSVLLKRVEENDLGIHEQADRAGYRRPSPRSNRRLMALARFTATNID